MGTIGLLSEAVAGRPQFSAIARMIDEAAERGAELTRHLLAFARKQPLRPQPTDINQLVTEIDRLLRPTLGEQVQIATILEPDTWPALVDQSQLTTALLNLALNARDAMPDGGKLTLEAGNIVLDEGHAQSHGGIRPGLYVVISVSDTGLGMDKETQSRMFEPFFTTKEKGKGTGLGLSTVYGIIKQSAGYIFVQSAVGQGTTFSIYLPRVQGTMEPHGATPDWRTAAGGSETVLLVEDEESVRQLVRETLEAKGYHVIEAENGNAGLAAAVAHKGTIDLVITDVIMPAMGGHELAQRLLESRPAIKVLYLSGYTEDAIVDQNTGENSKAFLQKPFTLQNLARKVREVLEA